jgi:hypothetical protein
MKKGLLAVLIVFIATALYAGTDVDPLAISSQAARDKVYKDFGTSLVQFDISGEFDARGLSWQNINLTKDAKVNTNYYRGYMDLWPKLKIGDTQLITKLEMWDQNPWAAYPVNGYSDDPVASGSSVSKKNQVSVERAYIHHNFNDAVFMEVGLMDGNWWGSSFMDTQLPRYRIKFVDTKSPVGLLGALVEKDTETGNQLVQGADRDDGDAYAIFGATKVGNIFLKPLIFYVPNSSFTAGVSLNATTPAPLVSAGLPATTDQVLSGLDKGNHGAVIWYYALESDGKLGPLSFEAEAGLKTYRTRLDANFYAPNTFNASKPYSATPLFTTVKSNTWNEHGFYLNVWGDLDIARLGALAAYGSYDRNGGPTGAGWGNEFGDDFKSNLILGDEKGFGSSTALDLYGMTLIKPYIKYLKLGMDKLTGSASLGYIISNQNGKNDAGAYSIYKGVKAYELDLGVQYKISKNLLYKVDGGYANISVDKDHWKDANGSNKDPDAIMLLRHEIVLTF